MKRLTRLLLWIFAILAVTDILLVYLQYDTLRYASKILLVPTLFLGYLAETSLKSSFSKLLCTALFFCWLGDVFLLFSQLIFSGTANVPGCPFFLHHYTVKIKGKGPAQFPAAGWTARICILDPFLRLPRSFPGKAKNTGDDLRGGDLHLPARSP